MPVLGRITLLLFFSVSLNFNGNQDIAELLWIITFTGCCNLYGSSEISYDIFISKKLWIYPRSSSHIQLVATYLHVVMVSRQLQNHPLDPHGYHTLLKQEVCSVICERIMDELHPIYRQLLDVAALMLLSTLSLMVSLLLFQY